MADTLVKPPVPCPDAYKSLVETIHDGLSKLYAATAIPYFIQSNLAKAGFTTVGDLRYRWGTPQEAIKNSSSELDFSVGNNGYDATTTLHTSIRLGQLINLAAKADEREAAGSTMPEMHDYESTLLSGQRQDLEKAYLGCYHEVAKINHQGSDHLTAVINRSLARGELVYTDLRHIVPYMPDTDSKDTATRKTNLWGYLEESIWEPCGEAEWKQTMTVFRTTLLMCLAGNPNQTRLTHKSMP
jgi:hypothetical protein